MGSSQFVYAYGCAARVHVHVCACAHHVHVGARAPVLVLLRRAAYTCAGGSRSYPLWGNGKMKEARSCLIA